MTESDKAKWNEFRKETETDTEATHRWMQWKCLTDLFFLGYETWIEGGKGPDHRASPR